MSGLISDNQIGEKLAESMGTPPTGTLVEETPAVETPVAETTEATPATITETPETQEVQEAPVVAEQKEVAAETTETATPGVNSGADDLNSFLADDTRNNIWDEAVTETETPQSEVNIPEEIQTKAEGYDKLMSDHRVKTFVDYIENGGKIEEFASTIGIKDVDKLSDEQLFKLDLEELGITGDTAIEEIERFNDMSAYEKKRQVNDIRSKHKNRNEEALKNFSAVSPEQKQAQAQEAARQQQIIQAATTELDNRIAKMTGNKFYNLEITQEMSNQVKSYVAQNTQYKYEGGKPVGFDIPASIETAVWSLYKKPLLRAVQEAAKVQAIDKTLNERHRPSDNSTTNTSQRVTSNDTYKDALEAITQRSQSKFKRVPAGA